MLDSFFAVFFIVLVVPAIILAYKNKSKYKLPRKEDLLFEIPGLVILLALVYVSFQNIEDITFTGPTPYMVLGAVMFIVSLIIRISAHMTIGSNYSWALEIREGHTLVKNGLYRYVRHPIYLGTILGAMSIPVFTASLMGFLIGLLTFPLFVYRIIIEEKMLIEEFGDEYLEYIEETWRLVPLLY